MNAEQKRAWLAVVTGLVAIVGAAVLSVYFGRAGMAAFGVFGLNGFGVFFRGEKPDERDRQIAIRSTFGGAMVSYMAIVLFSMGAWFFYRHRGVEEVSVQLLPAFAFIAMIALFFARGIFVLGYYYRGWRIDNA